MDTLNTESVRRYYDFWGKRYDLFSFYEAKAKERALELLDLKPGHKVLNVGLGTGKDQLQILDQVASGGIAFGVDVSLNMLRTALKRTGPTLVEADGRSLPFSNGSFDRLYSAYTLDLIPSTDLLDMLTGFRRVLKPGGQMVLLSLTEGVSFASRAFVSVWKTAYSVSPISCGGCRPLVLTELVRKAGFTILSREVVVQFAVPSEICVAGY